jgi:hypothetical protein
VTVAVVPETLPMPEWDLYDEARLLVPSPLLMGRAREDAPLTPEIKAVVAQLFAERSVNHSLGIALFRPLDYSDAQWLYAQYIAWLAGRFTGNPAYGSAFLESLVVQFGETLPGQLLRALSPDSRIGILQYATSNVAVQDLGIERLNAISWRDFFQWRLTLEVTMLRDGVSAAYFDLYDLSDTNATAAANVRRDQFDYNRPPPTVNNVTITRDDRGNLLAYVDALPDANDLTQRETIIFRWVDTTWKRLT